MTRGESVFEISRDLGLDDTVGSDELKLMQRWWSRGIVDVLGRTRCYVDIGTMALQAGVTDYRLDSSILVVDNITLPDTAGMPYELEIVDMPDLVPYLSPSVAATATPTRASIDGSLMRIAPIPSSVVTLTYVYVPKPTAVPADGTTANDGIDPSNPTYGGIPDEFHDAILAFMLWKGAEYDQQGGGFYRGHAFAPGSAFEAVYSDRCKEIRKQFRRKAGRGLHAGRIGYPGTSGPTGRNDVYPRYGR